MKRYKTISRDDLYKWANDVKFKRFDELEENTQSAVMDWINSNLEQRKTLNTGRTVYGIKHVLQCQTGTYLTESQFADALIKCGFRLVTDPRDYIRTIYTYVSNRSPAFHDAWRKI